MLLKKAIKKVLPKSKEAFSLLEIVAALGLFVILMIGITQLLPLLQQRVIDTEQSTKATCIAQTIFNILQVTQREGVIAIGPHWQKFSGDLLHFSLEQSSSHYVAYNRTGEPVRLLTDQEYNQGVHEPEITTAARITCSPNLQLLDIFQSEVVLTTPAAHPLHKRHQTVFVQLLRNQ